jgi:NAD(P)-dependent dehydrogenase (short-subunit alcohol dehydrogenase family)
MPQTTFQTSLYAGSTVLVTGGGSGIGLAIAENFGLLGAKVIIAARDKERLQQAEKQLQDQGIDVLSESVNIRDESSVELLFASLQEAGSVPDILINNAGGQFAAPALDISANGFRSVVDLNLMGTFHMSKAFAEACKAESKAGNIINIVLCQESGIPGMAHASAARAGVVNLTKTLAWEWADYNIRVNAIAPGTIKTSGLENYDQENLQKCIDALPLKRMGTPEEVAQAIAFLTSPAASYITGICLAQDGGEHLTGASPQL